LASACFRPPEQGLDALRQINGRLERTLIRWGLGTSLTEKIARQAVAGAAYTVSALTRVTRIFLIAGGQILK
jgi:hypothetical protein